MLKKNKLLMQIVAVVLAVVLLALWYLLGHVL